MSSLGSTWDQVEINFPVGAWNERNVQRWDSRAEVRALGLARWGRRAGGRALRASRAEARALGLARWGSSARAHTLDLSHWS
jgi:hypothetical protein